MAKIMFVGDTHFQSESPSSRKEDPEHYRQTQLDKLESIKQICIKEDIRNLIILGDVYNSSINIYTPYLTKLYEVFRDFNKKSPKIYKTQLNLLIIVTPRKININLNITAPIIP